MEVCELLMVNHSKHAKWHGHPIFFYVLDYKYVFVVSDKCFVQTRYVWTSICLDVDSCISFFWYRKILFFVPLLQTKIITKINSIIDANVYDVLKRIKIYDYTRMFSQFNTTILFIAFLYKSVSFIKKLGYVYFSFL